MRPGIVIGACLLGDWILKQATVTTATAHMAEAETRTAASSPVPLKDGLLPTSLSEGGKEGTVRAEQWSLDLESFVLAIPPFSL